MSNEEILNELGFPECNCDAMYKSRDMEDPNCIYHETIDVVKLAMDAARGDESAKYYKQFKMTEKELSAIKSSGSNDIRIVTGEIGSSVYYKNKKGKWVDVTDYSTW